MPPLLAADRAQSSVVGYALIIGLVAIAVVTTVVLGGAAITDARNDAEFARAEQSMTQFDSQAAQVALGDSGVQSTDFGRLDGTFQVQPSTGSSPGRITITHVNFDGGTDGDGNTVDDGSSDDDEDLYSGTLGSVVYKSGDREIAYQGGGVWMKERGGEARMISPPEFHYRGGTLTLPVIKTQGTAAASGDVVATTRQAADTVRKFPDPSKTYSDGTTPYLNSLSNGYVVIRVESEYYEAWAEYFRTRTDGVVSVDDANNEVKLELLTLGLTGPFNMPSDPSNGGGSLEVQGIEDGHSLTDFTFTIYPKDGQESQFQNLRWSMYVDEGNQKFEVALKASSADCGQSVDLSIYYSDDGHTSYEGWTGSETVQCSDIDGDNNDERYLAVDLVDPDPGSDQDLTYEKIPSSDLAHYKNAYNQNDIKSTGDLPSHGVGDHTDRTYTEGVGEVESVEFVVAHYFAELGPNFELHVEDQQGGGGAGVDESLSEGYIDYGGGGRVVTYLHITENEIEVDLE